MKITRKSEYACLAIIDLARNYKKGLLTIRELAERNNIPKKYLEQILLHLKNAGFVSSVRGKSGGYKLSKSPKEITVAEVIRIIDGPIAPVESVSENYYEHTPAEQNEELISLFEKIRECTVNILEKTTFQEMS